MGSTWAELACYHQLGLADVVRRGLSGGLN
jgi:hypothetical protein